jgi:23S rRNA pseudouridine1911/1915/1917 synthase
MLIRKDPIHEHYRLRIGKNPDALPLQILLGSRIHKFTREKFQFYSTRGRIDVNGHHVDEGYIPQPGDEIVLYSPYQLKADIFPVPMELDVVYEDDALLVINKPAGLVMHPGLGNHHLSLLHGLQYHFQKKGEQVQMPNGLVHRIDKGTAGLVVVAKLGKAHKSLTRQFRNKEPERCYHALIHGRLDKEEDTLTNYTGRNPDDRKKLQVFGPDEKRGKLSITSYKVLEQFEEASLLQCVLGTGRTHQIRLHMSFLGHPLIQDARYGSAEFDNQPYEHMPGHALIAKTLGFEHPYSKEFIRFEINYPEWFEDLLRQFRYASRIPTAL